MVLRSEKENCYIELLDRFGVLDKLEVVPRDMTTRIFCRFGAEAIKFLQTVLHCYQAITTYSEKFTKNKLKFQAASSIMPAIIEKATHHQLTS